jgi:hypothetical protein
MPRFFNRIRKRLARDNKFFQYSRYAIGEILLVVIGILIALQIDTWNKEREQQESVRRYFYGLIEDLNKDLDQYKAEGDASVFRFHSLQHVLEMLGERVVRLQAGEEIRPLTTQNRLWSRPIPDQPDSLFIALTFLWSVRDAHPVMSTTTINEMTSTGAFSFIRNKSLKDAINDYYNDFEWRFKGEFFAASLDINDKWKSSLLMDGILVQDLSSFEDPLVLFRDNAERIGLLRSIIRTSWFRASSLDVMEARAQELIQQIELELNQ